MIKLPGVPAAAAIFAQDSAWFDHLIGVSGNDLLMLANSIRGDLPENGSRWQTPTEHANPSRIQHLNPSVMA